MQCIQELGRLIQREREALLADWRSHVVRLPSAKGLDVPTLDDSMPLLLGQLGETLCEGPVTEVGEEVERDSAAHGLQRFATGFDIEEVVAEYGALRGCIYELAVRHGLPLEASSLHVVDDAIDFAVGNAVGTYAAEQAAEIRRQREEYLAFVAHDLRTPLNAISLAASVLETQLPAVEPDSTPDRMLKALRRNARHIQDLVERVLEENTRDREGIRPQPRPIDLWPFVEGLLRDLEPLASASGTRLQNAVSDPVTVHADADLLRRILENLVSNAIEYSPKGTVVVGVRKLDGTTEVWVADDGAGIPKERLDRIFDKYQTDPQRPSTGLGLSIAKQFVEMHGGRLTVESTEGAGSTFRFTLPGPAG